MGPHSSRTRTGLTVALSGLFVFLLAFGLLRGREEITWEILIQFADRGGEILQNNSVLLFLALVVLPGLPFPASVLFAAAGLAWGNSPALACFLCWVALSLNMTWTYYLAVSRLNGRLLQLLKRWGLIPKATGRSELDWILMIRLAPGIPLFAQNYYLGTLRVSFTRYLLVSMACSGPLMTAVVLISAGFAGEKLQIVTAGIAFAIFGIVLLRFLGSRMRPR